MTIKSPICIAVSALFHLIPGLASAVTTTAHDNSDNSNKSERSAEIPAITVHRPSQPRLHSQLQSPTSSNHNVLSNYNNFNAVYFAAPSFANDAASASPSSSSSPPPHSAPSSSIADSFITDFPNTNSSIANSTVAPTKIIAPQQIAASNARGQTLTQVLAENGGMQTTDFFGDGSRFALNMRGFGGDNANSNTLVLIDGVPYTNPDTCPTRLNFLSLGAIERVEVMQGSAVVLYGDQATGGVVNIITQPPRAHEASAQFAYGSNNTHQEQLTLGNVWHKHSTNRDGSAKNSNSNSTWSVRLNAQQYGSDNYRQHNRNQNNSFNVLLNRHDDSSDIDLIYRKNYQRIQIPGALTWPEMQENRRQSTSGFPFNAEDIDLWQLNFKRQLGADWRVAANAMVHYMKGKGAFNVNQNPVTTREERKTYTLNMQLNGTIKAGKGDKFALYPIIGGEIAGSNYSLNAMSKSTSQKNDNAIYGQISAPLTQSLTAIAGARTANARYDLTLPQQQLQPTNRATATSLELSWQERASTHYYLRRVTTFHFPKVDEETFTLTGAPLKPQAGVSYEGGVVHSGKRAKFAAMLYQIDLHDEITAIPIATSNYFIYNINLPPTTRRGATLDAALKLTPKLTLSANYNFVDAHFKSGIYKDKQLPFVAQHSGQLAATYAFNKAWYVAATSSYTGQRHPINDMENRAAPLGGFTLHNISCGYSGKNYDVALRVNNITNKSYYGYVVTTYTHAGGTSEMGVNNVYYPLGGISALLTLTVHL